MKSNEMYQYTMDCIANTKNVHEVLNQIKLRAEKGYTSAYLENKEVDGNTMTYLIYLGYDVHKSLYTECTITWGIL